MKSRGLLVLLAAVSKRAEAPVINGDPVWNNPPDRLPQLLARAGLPAIYFLRTQVQAGGLMSFGPDFVELSRRAAIDLLAFFIGCHVGTIGSGSMNARQTFSRFMAKTRWSRPVWAWSVLLRFRVPGLSK